jgi:precorrin-2 methylase
MVAGVISNTAASPKLQGAAAAAGASVSSANDQIRQDKQKLDDWTTCVSAKTTKGQAEIQRLSSDLSAAENRAHRLTALKPQALTVASSRSIDTWA